MAWLAGLAGKAENFLNKVDQSAANALKTDDDVDAPKDPFKWHPPPSQLNANHSTYSPYLSQTSTPPLKAGGASNGSQKNSANSLSTTAPSSISNSASVPSNLNKMNAENNQTSQMSKSMYTASQSASVKQSPAKPELSSTKAPVAASTNSSSLVRKKDKDDELFEFLNSPDTVDNKERKNGALAVRAVSGEKHSRHSSTSSSASTRSGKTPELPTSTEVHPADRPDSEVIDMTSQELAEDVLGNESSSGYHSNQEDSAAQQQLSSLELENRLLKNEVASLNQEMTSIIQRARESQEELSVTKRKLSQQSSNMSHSDQMVREMRSREGDLQEALAAKDSQLAVLRVRYEEADHELGGLRKVVNELQTEKNRILHDHTSVSGVQSQALDSLKDKLNESEFQLRREQDATQRKEVEFLQQHSSVEAEKQHLSSELSSLQKRFNEEKAKHSDLAVQLKTSKSQVDAVRHELSEYKDKATRILQSKDKLIANLKDGSSGGTLDAGSVTTEELEQTKQERDMLREELQRTQMNVENMRTEINELEMQLQQDGDSAQEQIGSLDEQLRSEQQRREDSEQEGAKQKQELRYAHEELLKQKTAFQSRLQDREMEIERLRNQLTTKSMSTSSQVELENRLHSLTESLIQKQTMLEALSTEKNSLVLQLERLEKQCREAEASAVRASITSVHVNEEEDVRQRLPGFMRESPLDGDVTRRVKRAANTIDRFSVRLGVFLRRYPIARIFVIVYMILLHLWVMIVLLTYQPEMHGSDYPQPEPPN